MHRKYHIQLTFFLRLQLSGDVNIDHDFHIRMYHLLSSTSFLNEKSPVVIHSSIRGFTYSPLNPTLNKFMLLYKALTFFFIGATVEAEELILSDKRIKGLSTNIQRERHCKLYLQTSFAG